MKKIYYLIQITVLFLVLFNIRVSAQPYYFFSEQISSNYNNIYRVNLSTGEKDLFLSNVLNPLDFTCDNYQEWFFLFNRFGISIYNPESPAVIETVYPDSNYDIGISAIVTHSQNILYLSWPKEETDYWVFAWVFNTSIFNSQTLSQIKKSSVSIHPLSFLSSDENYIYQVDVDSVREKLITKYSIAMDSIIDVKYFSDIYNSESVYFDYGYDGKVLLSYNELVQNNTPKYFVYDLENNNYYPSISFHYRSYGYLSPNAEYVILQKALWDTTKPSGEDFNGEISVYKTSTGELVKDFSLPPDGKILTFDSYPNDVYYVVNFETQPDIYNLTRPVLNSLSPSLGFPSGLLAWYDMVTATVTGELFTDSSVVYFNGQSKSTTYISDSVLTFPLLSFDTRTTGNYPVWVSNYGANSDTIYFSAVDTLPQPVTPVLNCVRDNGDKTFTAFFGYNNQNNAGVYITVGIENIFSPSPSYRGQPKVFLPGVHSYVFSVNFNGYDLTWTLNGTSVTANKKSTLCP